LSINQYRVGKRQAALILYIFVDGIHQIPPKIIFHGKSTVKLQPMRVYFTTLTSRLLSTTQHTTMN
jgi:hypothetical protein